MIYIHILYIYVCVDYIAISYRTYNPIKNNREMEDKCSDENAMPGQGRHWFGGARTRLVAGNSHLFLEVLSGKVARSSTDDFVAMFDDTGGVFFDSIIAEYGISINRIQ